MDTITYLYPLISTHEFDGLQGGGDFVDELKELVRIKKLEKSAIFLGRIDESDMRDIYSCCDVFSLISTTQCNTPRI